MNVRLYLDEDISPRVATLLRARGHDVVSAHEIGAVEISDDEQIARAIADSRTIVSCNHHDFVRIAREYATIGARHFGIVISYRQFDTDELGIAADLIERLMTGTTAEALQDVSRVLQDYAD